nr:hypothetical protein [uncultured Acetatifactor sp.]
MRCNSIKMICNHGARTISYYIKNETDEWIHVDSSSPLSRKEYTQTSIYESAEKIIETIDEIYNTGNRGVDLEMECTNDEFMYLSSLIEKEYGDTNIISSQKETTTQSELSGLDNDFEKFGKNDKKEKYIKKEKGGKGSQERKNPPFFCKQNRMQVAFAGKVSSGKTTLIDALAELNNIRFSVLHENDYILHQNMEGSQLWYEIAGIDIGKINIEKAYATIKRLIKTGMDVLIYCFSTNKIEATEENILLNIRSEFPNVRILAVLTSCVDDDAIVYAERMSNSLKGIKALPVLAKDKKVKNGIIPAYGLEDISRFIYGGK